MKSSLIILTAFLLFACDNEKKEKQDNQMYKTTGTFERFDPSLDLILDTNVKAEIIAEGFEWSEGALWVEKENMLLFSDVPMNTIYKWTESNGKETYLKPSGYTGSEPSISKEPGSNGLTLDSDGSLVMCQHGDRRVARMDAALS
ncbi:MAG: SMP-30/gluconolactonase/LRE family protein, partial [Chitinophagaceae bacterium]|nr:SMP-30/gluconolactonase/LRE family protein [Chitinophagaceae bacterium]